MYDRYTDVAEHINRQLLTGDAPPSHVTAREQLNKAGIKVKAIIATRPEAILFVNLSDQVVTAWSEVRESGAVAFYCEAGMPAFPAEA